MAELVVCRAPGDELVDFGALLLSRPPGRTDVVAVFTPSFATTHAYGEKVLRAAGKAYGARSVRLLRFAGLEHDRIDPPVIAQALGPMDGYERVYTHSVQDERPLCARIAAAVGRAATTVWTAAGAGRVDEIIQSDDEQFERRLQLLAAHYSPLLAEGSIHVRELKSVQLFQKHAGADLYRYFRGYVDWHVGDFEYTRPWDLEISDYEQRRHELELNTLRKLPWNTLVEVGACEGAFTEKLCNAFPQRRIIALEPDKYFFAELERRLGARIELHCADAEAAGDIPCDVLLMSSAVYYLWKVPYRMLHRALYVVLSHARRYHRDYFDKVMRSQGFKTVDRAELKPCFEPMDGILEIKYGTEVRVWKRVSE